MARSPDETARRESEYDRLPLSSPASDGCWWPLWRFGELPTMEFCRRRRVAGKPYCPKHCAISYDGPIG